MCANNFPGPSIEVNGARLHRHVQKNARICSPRSGVWARPPDAEQLEGNLPFRGAARGGVSPCSFLGRARIGLQGCVFEDLRRGSGRLRRRRPLVLGHFRSGASPQGRAGLHGTAASPMSARGERRNPSIRGSGKPFPVADRGTSRVCAVAGGERVDCGGQPPDPLMPRLREGGLDLV